MAMVAAEAAGTEAGAGAAGGASSGASSTAGAGSSRASTTRLERGQDYRQRPTPARGSGDRQRTSQQLGQVTQTGNPDAQKQDRSLIPSASSSGSGKTYHRIVLAEFAACVILVGASPILTPKTKKNGTAEVVDASVSLAGPLVRLTAVSIVFFVLALLASGQKTGKIAAAFGALITLGVALNSTPVFTALASAFKGPAGAGAAGLGAAAGDAAAQAAGEASAETPVESPIGQAGQA